VGGFFPVGYQDGGQGTVGPTINGTTLTMTLRQALASGHVNHVQVIAGTDRDEDLVGTAATAAQYQSLVDTQYGPFASQVLAKYPLSHFDNPGVAWRTVAADSDTVCPAMVTAQDLASRLPTRESTRSTTTTSRRTALRVPAWLRQVHRTLVRGSSPR
jgi:hypothetical protein